MVNYREILRLHSQDYSQRQIANSVGSSRNTVSDVLLTAQKLQLTVGDCEIMSDEALLAVLIISQKMNHQYSSEHHQYQ